MTPWGSKKKPHTVAKNEDKGAGAREKKDQEKARQEYEKEKQDLQDRQEENRGEKKKRKGEEACSREIAETKTPRKAPRKPQQEKEAEGKEEEGNRITELGKELEKTRKELTRGPRNLRGEEKQVEERDRKQDETEDRLQAQRKTLGKAIAQAMQPEEKSSNKAPPPAPTKTKSPHGNTTQGKRPEDPPNSPKTRSVQLEEDIRCSSREDEHENIVAGPIDLTNPEQVTGPHNRMTLAIAEEKDVPGRKRYIEKQSSSQTFEIICGPAKLGRILTEMANGPTQATLCDLQMPAEAYYAEVITYMNNYLWQIEDFPPHQSTPNSGK